MGLGQVMWGIHMTGHEGGQGGGASPGDLKLLGVMLGVKEKVGGDRVENQELGVESLQLAITFVKTDQLERSFTNFIGFFFIIVDRNVVKEQK